MGGGSQESSSGDTALSRAQAEILKAREEQYQAYFFPELLSQMEQNRSPGAVTPTLAAGRKALDSAAGSAKSQLTQSLNQRGLAGSGVETQGLVALESSKMSALADMAAKAEQERRNRALNLLQMGGSLSPSPTQAAPLSQESKGWSFSL
jgi:hypothetical protein